MPPPGGAPLYAGCPHPAFPLCRPGCPHPAIPIPNGANGDHTHPVPCALSGHRGVVWRGPRGSTPGFQRLPRWGTSADASPPRSPNPLSAPRPSPLPIRAERFGHAQTALSPPPLFSPAFVSFGHPSSQPQNPFGLTPPPFAEKNERSQKIRTAPSSSPSFVSCGHPISPAPPRPGGYARL